MECSYDNISTKSIFKGEMLCGKTYSDASKCASEHVVGKTEAGWKTIIAEGDYQ